MTRFYVFLSTSTHFILPGLCLFLSALPFSSRAQISSLPKVNSNFPLKSPAQAQVSSLTAGNQNRATANQAIAGQYIVVYKNTSTAQARVSAIPSFPQRQQLMRDEANATLLKNKLSGKRVLRVYDTALKGFAVSGLTGAEVDKLRQDDQIAYIESDQVVSLDKVGAPTMLAASCNGPSITLNGGTPNYAVGVATFGSKATVSGQVILVNDGSAPITDGCGNIQNNISGKIALIDRGSCDFVTKSLNAQQAGAIGVIIVNNAAGDAPGMSGTNASVTIPVMSLSLNDGNALKTALGIGTVTAILDQTPPDALSQCTPWGISRVGGGASGVGKRAWIIDSGIDLTHPDLNVNTGLSATFVPNTTNATDINGHGTHVAGTVAAKDNGIGVIGVAAGAEVVAVRVFLDENGTISAIIEGVNYVAGNPNLASTDVVNMSLGGAPSQAIDEAVLALSNKCKVVIAAGNDSKNANYVSPARVNGSNIFTVSAMDYYGKIAGFSNYGNGPVDYSAPGVNIASCYINGGYAYLSGTSMAAPHVTGILLLGTICASSKITGDPDGTADLIATVFSAASSVDNDLDGYTTCGGDYDDNDATIHPNATELCDNKDNNQNGQIDEGTACCPAGLAAGILYVNASASGANTGVSWMNAFTSLQSALTAAKRCTNVTQIWVAKGTYYPSVDAFGNAAPTDPRTKSFAMQNNLAIYGGFAGTEPSNFNLNLRNLNTNPTILSGEIQHNMNTINTYHVVLNFPASGSPLTNTAILDGFTVRDGYANFVTSGTTPSVSVPDSYGGGIYTYGSNPIIRNCSFFNNVAYFGGGMANNTSNPTLFNNFFVGNVAFVGGGGLANIASSPTLTYSAFAANGTNGANGVGGGVYNSTSSPTLTNCYFQLNSSQYGGGLANFNSSNPILTNCSFSGNAAVAGGGMYNYDGSSPTLKSSILWGNSTEVSSEPASATVAASNPAFTYSIIRGGWSGAGSNNLNLDPQFVSQPAIGQLTLGDLSLASCSPAINAGDPSATAGTVGTFDLAGNPRLYASGRIDMGPYEFQGSPTTLPTASLTPSGLLSTPGASVTLTASPTTGVTYVFSPGATQLNGGNLASVTQAGTYSVVVTASPGCSVTASATVLLAPDLIATLYAQPTTVYNTTNLSLVVKIQELNSVPTSGTVIVKFTKDPLLTMTFDPSLTILGGRLVQNSGWVFDTSDPDFYTLTSTQPGAVGVSRSIGVSGQLKPGNTKGTLAVSMTVLGSGVGELRTINNADADKVDYFNK